MAKFRKGWVQDRIDFAPEANALVKKLRAESRASLRLARKGPCGIV